MTIVELMTYMAAGDGAQMVVQLLIVYLIVKKANEPPRK